MKISEYLAIRKALVPALLSAGRHAAVAKNGLHAGVVPDETDEHGSKLVPMPRGGAA